MPISGPMYIRWVEPRKESSPWVRRFAWLPVKSDSGGNILFRYYLERTTVFIYDLGTLFTYSRKVINRVLNEMEILSGNYE